jgi:hypothetical protein
MTLPILILLKGSPLYQGLRQVLFTVPAFAVLAAFGAATLLGMATRQRTRAMIATAAGLGLALPIVAQCSMFPFQYSYVNVVAEAARVPADNDPLETSYRSVMPHLPQHVKIVCPHFNSDLRRKGRGIGDCRTRSRGTLGTYWKGSLRPRTDRPKTNEYYAILRGADHIQVPPFCHTVYTTRRWRNLGPTVINRVAKCAPRGHRRKDAVTPTPAVNPWDPGWVAATPPA